MVIFTAVDSLSTSYRIKYCMSVVVSLVAEAEDAQNTGFQTFKFV